MFIETLHTYVMDQDKVPVMRIREEWLLSMLVWIQNRRKLQKIAQSHIVVCNVSRAS